MDNTINVNFKGGFWIKKPKRKKGNTEKDIWNEILQIMPRHKQVIENFNEEGDKFIATKTCYDKEISYKLLQKNLDFKFYPDINLKTRLDGNLPKESMDVVNTQKRVLKGHDEINDFFSNSNTKYRPISKYNWYPEDYIDQTLKFLNLKKENCNISIKNGIAIISDKFGNTIAKASPNNHSGYNFVYIRSHYNNTAAHNELSQMLCLNYNGEREARYAPSEFSKFYELFMKNVKIGLGRKLPMK